MGETLGIKEPDDAAGQAALADVHADHGGVAERQLPHGDLSVTFDERLQSRRVEKHEPRGKARPGRQAHEWPPPSAAVAGKVVEIGPTDRRHIALVVHTEPLRRIETGNRLCQSGVGGGRLQPGGHETVHLGQLIDQRALATAEVTQESYVDLLFGHEHIDIFSKHSEVPLLCHAAEHFERRRSPLGMPFLHIDLLEV